MSGPKRILYACPETAGDILISTGVIRAIKTKWPQAKIYFATKKEYFNILKGFPLIESVVEYDENMLNYRAYETWGPQQNLFDVVYCPFIVTQRTPHWIHQGYGEFIGDVYAHMCDVPACEEQWIQIEDVSRFNLPSKFITVHSQTRQDPKDFDNMQQVVDRIKNIPVIQIGGAEDKKLNNVAANLCGQTTPQELADILQGAKLHVGLDSFPMHVALHVGIPVVAMFGGTYMKQGVFPLRKHLLHGIETHDRGPCPTSCHLIECEAKKIGFDKCINNISVDSVCDKVAEIIGSEHVIPNEPITISSYIIIKDGIKYGFPFEECIMAAAKVSDEVIVVDGGSTDGTKEKLIEIQKQVQNGLEIKTLGALYDAFGYPNNDNHALANSVAKLKLFEHPWDMDNPSLMGDEKTYARRQCTGTWLIQLDADEIIQEPHCGAIRELITKWKSADCLDIPCINFYENENTIRVEENGWKWRITQNNPNIIHGVNTECRIFDPETCKITYDKKRSDSCEYIYEDTGRIVNHKNAFPFQYLVVQRMVNEGVIPIEEYVKEIDKLVKNSVCVFHYSWFDLNRKTKNGEFWDSTHHGKKNATHNTTKDISERITGRKDLLATITFNHPLRSKNVYQVQKEKAGSS